MKIESEDDDEESEKENDEGDTKINIESKDEDDEETEEEIIFSEECTKWINKYSVGDKFDQIVKILNIPPSAEKEIIRNTADLIWKC